MAIERLRPVDPQILQREYYAKELADYEWVDQYLRTQELLAELKEREKERNGTGTAMITKKERLEAARGYFRDYQDRRTKTLSSFLGFWSGEGDPLKYLKSADVQIGTLILHIPPSFTWEEIERAILLLPDGGLTQSEKNKALAKLNDRIHEIEKELLRVWPEKYHGRNDQDKRAILVSHWQNLQSRAREAVTPEAWPLEKYGTPAEKTAWKKLELGDFIDKKNGKLGCDPY